MCVCVCVCVCVCEKGIRIEVGPGLRQAFLAIKNLLYLARA